MTIATNHPDWSTITQRIACPLCDYELRGLIEPRCPECGYQFSWDVMLDPREQKHPYLFEHYPKSNIWSFWKTKFAAMIPWKFWETLKPTHEIVARRLMIYWILCAGVMVLLIPGAFVAAWYQVARDIQIRRALIYQQFAGNPSLARSLIQRYGSIQKAVDATLPSIFNSRVIHKAWSNLWGRNRSPWRATILIAAFIVWPWALNWTLMIFQTTMRRAKIKPIHVRRCVLYSCDNSLLIGALMFWMTPVSIVTWQTNPEFVLLLNSMLTGSVIIGVITAFKLGFAYRKYLQFPWAWSTVILAELVVMLASVTFVAAAFSYSMD